MGELGSPPSDETAKWLKRRRVAHVGGIMKKAIVVIGLALFCMAGSQNAWATSDVGFKRLGVDVGIVDPEAAGSTVGFGAFADLGRIAPDVRLSTHVGYWKKSENQFGAEASVRDINFAARASYM